MDLQAFEKWHKTRAGHLVLALAELALAYAFASLAINSGSLWQWALVLLLVVGFLRNFIRLFWATKK